MHSGCNTRRKTMPARPKSPLTALAVLKSSRGLLLSLELLRRPRPRKKHALPLYTRTIWGKIASTAGIIADALGRIVHTDGAAGIVAVARVIVGVIVNVIVGVIVGVVAGVIAAGVIAGVVASVIVGVVVCASTRLVPGVIAGIVGGVTAGEVAEGIILTAIVAAGEVADARAQPSPSVRLSLAPKGGLGPGFATEDAVSI